MTRRQVAQDVYQREYGVPVPGARITDPTMTRRLTDPAWKHNGTCTRFGPTAWFEPERSLVARQAALACQFCPIRRLCLAAALTYGEEFGIWGGLTATQRGPLMALVHRGIPIEHIVDDALNDRRHDVAAS